MTEQKLSTYLGKNIIVTCTDDQIIKGVCEIFTRAIDNEPTVAEISLKVAYCPNGHICISLPEISSIEVIK